MVRKPAPEVFVSDELAKRIEELGTKHKITKWINNMKEVLEENIYAGELIRKKKPNS